MTVDEVLTLLIALVGAVTGVVSLIRTRRIAEQQLRFQAITAALEQRQLAALDQREAEKNRAAVTVALLKMGPGDYRFMISNDGAAPAMNVNFAIAADSPDNPLVGNECKKKLPFPKLDPGQSFTLIAAFGMGSAMRYATTMTWENQDGSSGSSEVHVGI